MVDGGWWIVERERFANRCFSKKYGFCFTGWTIHYPPSTIYYLRFIQPN